MGSDSTGKTIGVALAVTLVTSILVSTAVVTLKPLQDKNRELEKKRNVLLAVGIKVPKAEIDSAFDRIVPVVIDLKKGEIDTAFSPEDYDLRKILKDKNRYTVLDKKADTAGIRYRPDYLLVYMVKEGDKLENIILPIYGKGLWSTMYGFLALEKDMNTVKGITFYEHGETPGLGGEIDNPKWKSLWSGKEIYSADGSVMVEVIKGSVTPDMEGKQHKIDGLSGATLTSRGVHNTVRFWLGKNGYGPFLKKIAQKQGGN